jgi:hypothetical protein
MLAGLALSLASQLLQGIAVGCRALLGLGVSGAFYVFGQSERLSGYGAMDQRICSVELPTILMLLLTWNACYTSPLDTPSGHSASE